MNNADDVWFRYCYIRDNGHLDYQRKAQQCEDFFAGLQWSEQDLALLRSYRRPALTINKIISTLSTVMGEQIFNRMQVSFRPAGSGATQEVADTLAKLYKHIGDRNQLPWVRSDVFADGVVTSRGFFDVRMDFSNNLKGDIAIRALNPKNVMVDPDAEEYDPDLWGDVLLTKWMSPDMIEMMYGAEYAKELRGTSGSYSPYTYDSIDNDRDRFGNTRGNAYGLSGNSVDIVRNIRVIERQQRMITMQKHFINLISGDVDPIPQEWDYNRISEAIEKSPTPVGVVNKRTTRVRWTVVAGNLVLHDEWSPYKRLTVVPYFPHFRRGRTVGIVENLLGPQELLNKVSSQELHIANTTANSGYKVKTGALVNMSIAELEERGATTGIVMEVSGDPDKDIVKIQPNTVPTGLDRISFKAEEHMKSISGVPDSMQGFDREDVAAKAINTKRAAGQVNMAKVLDNLQRTDFMLARSVLDLVQTYITEERLIQVVADRLTGETETIAVNRVDRITGAISNDLSLGEFGVVVTSEPERETMEDSQFDQALGMFEKGIPVPPDILIEASRLRNKAEIAKRMRGDQESPEAQRKAALQARMEEAAVVTAESDAVVKQADAKLKQAKTASEVVKAQKEAMAPPEGEGGMNPLEQDLEWQKHQQEMAQKRYEFDQKIALEREKMEMEMQLKREEATMRMQLEKQKADDASLVAQQQAAAAAKGLMNPQPQKQPKTGVK
jgi:hypothetical protein